MKPRVAIVAYAVQHPPAAPSGLAEQIRRLCEEVDFTVVSTFLDDRLRPLVGWRPVPFVGFDSMRNAAASFFLRAPRELRTVRADLVHATLALIPNRVDIASVHWSHAALAELDPPVGAKERVLRSAAVAVERWCYGRTRVLTAVSRGSQRTLEHLYPGVPVLLTPNGVDRDRFRPDDEARSRASYENFSRSALEAAASGLPLVATPVDGTEELLAAGAGLAAESPEQMATALDRLAQDEALRRRLGDAGREATAAYTWDASAASVLDVYRRLLREVGLRPGRE